jgi:hypothetical protein
LSGDPGILQELRSVRGFSGPGQGRAAASLSAGRALGRAGEFAYPNQAALVRKAAIDETYGGARGFNFCCTTFWQGRLLQERKWNTLPYDGFYPIVEGDRTRLDVTAWRHVDEVLGRLESRGAY